MNPKWNDSNRKWNNFYYLLISYQNSSFRKGFLLSPTNPKLILKTGNAIIQTGNENISPISWPPMENFFYYIMFLNFANDFKTGFENRKLNYLNRKWNYFSYFVTSNQKHSFTKSFWLLKVNPKIVLKTVNIIIQTGNVQNWFEIQEIELSKQEMELFLLLPDLQSKNFFYKKFLTFRNESKTGFVFSVFF